MTESISLGNVEFIKTTPLSDLLSETTIKVMWVDENVPNLNDTIFTKEVATKMGSALPGVPVMGYFNGNDFEEHNVDLTQDENGEFSLTSLTKPIGFVSPLDNPWFEDFEENGTVKTYLCAKAYLWSERFPKEVRTALEGRPQSMELSNTNGYWMGDYFLFTDAQISSLCVLGEDVPPAFSGAAIFKSAAQDLAAIATEFSKTSKKYFSFGGNKIKEVKTDFARNALGWKLNDTLIAEIFAPRLNYNPETDYIYIEDLYEEGGVYFAICGNNDDYYRATFDFDEKGNPILTSSIIEVEKQYVPIQDDNGVTNIAVPLHTPREEIHGPDVVRPYQFIPKEQKGDNMEDKYTELTQQHAELTQKFSALTTEFDEHKVKYDAEVAKVAELEAVKVAYEAELKELRDYKAAAELAAKEAVIAEFTELTTDEVKPVVEKLDEYSVEQVSEKCAAIAYNKTKIKDTKVVLNYTASAQSTSEEVPAWVSAVAAIKE